MSQVFPWQLHLSLEGRGADNGLLFQELGDVGIWEGFRLSLVSFIWDCLVWFMRACGVIGIQCTCSVKVETIFGEEMVLLFEMDVEDGDRQRGWGRWVNYRHGK